MIQLIVDNTELDLSENNRIRLEKARAVIAGIEGEKTFSDALPASPRNLKKLGLVNHIDSLKKVEILPAVILKDSQEVVSGVFQVTGATEKTISYSIDSNLSVFKQRISKKKLADALNGLSYTFPRANTNYKYFGIGNPFPIGIRPAVEIFINNVLVAQVAANWGGSFSEVQKDLANQINLSPSATGYRAYAEDGVLHVLPIIDNSTADVELRYIDLQGNQIIVPFGEIIYNEVVIDDYDFTDFVFPRIRNKKLYNENTFSGDINVWTGSRIRGNRLVSLINQYAATPMIRLRFLLDKIFEMASFTWSGFFDGATDFIIYNSYELGKYQPFFRELPIPFNRYDEEVVYSRHVPDIEIEQYLLQLAMTYNLELDFVGTHCTFRNRISTLQSAPIQKEIAYKIEKISYSAQKNTEIKYAQNDVDFFAPYLYDVSANTTEELSLPVSSLRYDDSFAAIDERQGSTRLFTDYFQLLPTDPTIWTGAETRNEIPVKLLIWKGLQSGQPTASAKPFGTDFNLLINHENGLRTLFEDWLAFLNEAELVDMRIWLTSTELAQFSMYDIIQIGHRKFMHQKLSIDFENRRLQRASLLQAYAVKV